MSKSLRWIIGIVIVLILLGAAVVFFGGVNSGKSDGRQNLLRGYGGAVGTETARDMLAPSLGVPPSADEAAYQQKSGGEQNRLILRSATLAIVSLDVAQAVNTLKAYTESQGGFIVSAVVRQEEGEAPSAEVTLRIPAEKLDEVLEIIRKQAVRVVRESVVGQDVTEEYVDLTAKLKNLQASADQLRTIMREAKRTEDVLAVHRELERVQGEIDSLMGRKQYLEKGAKLSSVTVDIATDESTLPVVEPGEKWRPFVVAKAAMTAFVGVLKFLADVVIWVVIFLPIWGTAILVVRYWKRRRGAFVSSQL